MFHITAIFISFLCVATSMVANAQSRAQTRTQWQPKIENRLSVTPGYYFEDVGQGTTQYTSVIRGESEIAFKPHRDWRLKVSPWIYSDPSAMSQSEKFIFDVTEANVEQRKGELSFRAGINSVSWGVTDVFNPLDVVSARRYVDLLNPEKRGVPSLDLNWERENWRTEVIYVPVQVESILPGESSRWLPRDVSYNRESGTITGVLAPQFRYHYRDRAVRDGALNNNFGFRVERHGSGLDLTAIFFQGAPTAPAIFTPLIEGVITDKFYATDITLQPVYYMRRTVGVGAVWSLETLIVRIAAANSDRISQGSSLPGWSRSVVLGIERNVPILSSTLTVLLQATIAQHEERAENSVTSLDRIFDRAGLLGLRLATSSDWTWNLAGLYDAENRGWFGQLKGDYKINDLLTASIQGDWLEGGNGTPLGTYRRNRRVLMGVSFLF